MLFSAEDGLEVATDVEGSSYLLLDMVQLMRTTYFLFIDLLIYHNACLNNSLPMSYHTLFSFK